MAEKSPVIRQITVDDDNRIPFPVGIRPQLVFLSKDESTKGWIRIGSLGQIIAFADERISRSADELPKLLQGNPFSQDRESTREVIAARALLSLFPCTFNWEPTRNSFRITLPEELRKAGLAVGARSIVFVLCFGGFIEIWRPDQLAGIARGAFPSPSEIEDSLREHFRGND